MPAEPAATLDRSEEVPDGPEHAMRSIALSRLAAGLAHDIKNPLNAMALQIAILADKLADAGPSMSAMAASHLASMREQIARVNDTVRRFADVADPSAPLGYTDVGGLVADLARLFAHEARRRRIELVCEATRDGVRSQCDPARAGRILTGLFWRALAETPVDGRLHVRAAVEDGAISVRLEHTPGPAVPELAFVTAAAAASAEEMGGRLAVASDETGAHILLRLPKEAP